MDLAGSCSLMSRDINFFQVTMAFHRLCETTPLTRKHDKSPVSPMTRNDCARFVPRATVIQHCKERRTSRAGYEFVPKLGRYDTSCARFMDGAGIKSLSF